jgi:choline monooxygenase
MMSLFHIDPDIRKARTIASDFYTSERFFEISKKNIFSRTWQFIGDINDANGLHPLTLLRDFLDEPILITRSGGRLNCISNVCTHRGKILVEEPCSADLIRCGYHGRRFSLDGKFLSMPEFVGVEDFPAESDDLRKVELAEWAGFLFASIDPIAPFDRFQDGVSGLIGDAYAAGARLTASRDYEINAHWALYCENYLEGFHIPFVHQSLNEVVEYGTYTTETFRYASVQTGFDQRGNVAGQYLFVFPNTMLNLYPWGVSVNVVRPVSPSKTVVTFLKYISDETKLDSGAGADLHRVEMEDEKIVESVQQGIRSRFYTSGRYSPTREQGTHHFHRLIAEFME